MESMVRTILLLPFLLPCVPLQLHATGKIVSYALVQEDGSITALCTVKGEDLNAWMLKHGWAVALPDAPFEYHTLEKIAQHKRRGIWGHIIDPVIPITDSKKACF